MVEKRSQKNFKLPDKLQDIYAKKLRGKDYENISAAVAVFLTLNANLREVALKTAFREDIETALAELDKKIRAELSLPPAKHVLKNEIINVLREYKLISAEPQSEGCGPVISGEQIVTDVEQTPRKKYRKDPKTG